MGFSVFSWADRSLSTKLNTVVAALLSFNWKKKKVPRTLVLVGFVISGSGWGKHTIVAVVVSHQRKLFYRFGII